MRKIELRQKQIKLRKNFFPTFILIAILWSLLAGTVFFLDPQTTGSVPLFFILAFLTLIFTASTIFVNTRRGFLTAAGLTFFLVLRYFGVGNVLNFLLITGIAISLDIYFSKH